MDKIYIVYRATGLYDDYSESPIRAFLTKEEAEIYELLAEDENTRLTQYRLEHIPPTQRGLEKNVLKNKYDLEVWPNSDVHYYVWEIEIGYESSNTI